MLAVPAANARSLRSRTPAPPHYFLEGHTVGQAKAEGWDTLGNGELLVAAEAAGFEILITTDKNIRYRQNLAAAGVEWLS